MKAAFCRYGTLKRDVYSLNILIPQKVQVGIALCSSGSEILF